MKITTIQHNLKSLFEPQFLLALARKTGFIKRLRLWGAERDHAELQAVLQPAEEEILDPNARGIGERRHQALAPATISGGAAKEVPL